MGLSVLGSISKLLFVLQVAIFKLNKATTRSKNVDSEFEKTAGLLLGISSCLPSFEAVYRDEIMRVKLMAMSRTLAGSLEKPIYAAMSNAALVR